MDNKTKIKKSTPRVMVSLNPQVESLLKKIREKYPMSYTQIFQTLVIKYGAKEFGLEEH